MLALLYFSMSTSRSTSRPVISVLRGFAVLIASADEMKADRVFGWGGKLLIALALLHLPLAVVYSWQGQDWVSLLPDASAMLVSGLIGVGLARAVALRRRLRAEAGLS